MKRTVFDPISLGEGHKRFRVLLESPECHVNGPESRYWQFYMLKELGDNPSIGSCDLKDFQTLKMHHNGLRWVLELEATTE